MDKDRFGWKEVDVKPKFKYILLSLYDQGPILRFIRNAWNGRLNGLFHVRSHLRMNGEPKVGYGRDSSRKAAKRMGEKKNLYFSVYRCIFCGRYHIGADRYKERKDGNDQNQIGTSEIESQTKD